MCCLCRLLSPLEYVCSSSWKLPFFLQSLGLLLRWPQHHTLLPSPDFSFWSQLIQHCDIYTRKSISFLQQGPVMPFSHSAYTSASALHYHLSWSSGSLHLHHSQLPLLSPTLAPPSPAICPHPTSSFHLSPVFLLLSSTHLSSLPFTQRNPFLPSLPLLRLLPPTQVLFCSSAPPFDVCRESSA